MKVYDNIHDAYLGTLADVLDNPDYICSPRDQTIKEKLNYQFKVLNPVCESIVTWDDERNETIASYTAKEMELYNSGTNKAEDFAKASSFWNKIANPDGTINSAYGYLVFKNKSHGSQFETEYYEENPFWDEEVSNGQIVRTRPKMRTPWEFARESLLNDKDTRQAIIRFNLPEHAYIGNKDFTCTMHAIMHIRNNKLHMCTNMRSNDLMLGLVFDSYFFISLMYKMRDELRFKYKDLQIGEYTHQVHSMHLYVKDQEKIEKMLGRRQ
jgi:hypothetical protein